MKICLSIAKEDAEFQQMIQTLSQYAQVDVVGLSGYDLSGYDIFIGKRMSARALKTADRLKIAFAYKTGVDDFPLEEIAEKGVLLANSHADAHIIAEYAFGLSISLVNRITECDKKLRKGIWYDNTNPYWESFFDMKVGLLGYGHIGRHINMLLRRNHIETYTLKRDKEYTDIMAVDTLEELFRQTDLLILSLPKTPQTNHLINAQTLQKLRGKYIVNVGRSNCIDQAALYQALSEGWLAGAAIDTWDEKPKDKNSKLNPSKQPFVELDNVVLSPHQATRIRVGHQRYVSDITQKVIAYIENGQITDQVDLTKGY
ncbi:MAG: hypothetical protein IKB80_04150 [Oscillospiraceae bacterium]|nr:hypothetical protein [Oscillospiraceae bacterium]